MSDDAMPSWLAGDQALAGFVRDIPANQPVALDTEFQWSSTYYPVLALVQFGISRQCVGVADALAIREWQPLSRLLSSPDHQIILFSGANDLPLMVQACGGAAACLPTNLFDVQLASAFCGGGMLSPSLKRVVSQLLGIELDKHETRSDWTKRPLTASQMAYAGGDVALLPELVGIFSQQLSSNGNLAAFQEEMAALCAPEFYVETPVSKAWQRLKNFHALPSEASRSRARALAAWREGYARQRNLPRAWILADEQLLWLAEHNPKSGTAMAAMPPAGHGAGRHNHEAILDALASATIGEEDKPLPVLKPFQREKLAALKNRLAGLVASRAESRNIPAELLASKRELEGMLFNYLTGRPYRTSRLFSGWRAQLLLPTMDDILG